MQQLSRFYNLCFSSFLASREEGKEKKETSNEKSHIQWTTHLNKSNKFH